ncbi:hypothetical protein Tco_0291239 [Tanacetum coccineum]
MEISKADQIALDDALVAPANRLKISKYNLRLSSDVTSKVATLQVVYDVLKLTPFYKAFQVSADVLEIYMQEDDDILYKFKEGDFHRLRIQDIEDMLLLLVQGKLTNLNVEERLAFNVSLRMFTRSVVIQRRVEDLQLGVESYQNKLNLTKPDTNKDKKNRLMRIDELHKFSDGTLDDVRTALNDRLKGIRMEYLPHRLFEPSRQSKSKSYDSGKLQKIKDKEDHTDLEDWLVDNHIVGDLRLHQRTI